MTMSRILTPRSLSGRSWQLRDAAERMVQALAQEYDLADSVARILAARGFDKESAGPFLTPKLRDQMPDPSVFLDMDKAADRMAHAVMRDEKICIFGDYDVDGATSGAVLSRYLGMVGLKARNYIPDRLEEGYGPNAEAMRKLAGEGMGLCVTVDCGTTAFAPLEAAQQAGMDVIILDHHAAEAALPPAHAVVNPNRLDETSGHRNLAAVGVTFLFVVALNRALRQRGFFAIRKEPDLMALLDLVALGTVADVVSLTGLNRVFVAQGLEVMARRGNVGLAALMDVAGLKERPQAWHCGFFLGPRVNAGGRVGRSDLGTILLTTDNSAEARNLATELDRMNAERRAIEQMITDEALIQAEKQAEGGRKVLIVAEEAWHPGVIGIVASRIKERFNLPAIVIGSHKGKWTGSGRSVKGVDLGAAVIAARQAGLLTKGGGHQMAAGVSLVPDRLPDFMSFMDERISRDLDSAGGLPPIDCDAVISTGGATAQLVSQFERLAPFGSGNPEPRVMVRDVRVGFAKPVGGEGLHVSCQLQGTDGQRLKAIAFRAAGQPQGQALLEGKNRQFHVLGSLKLDNWQGKATPSLQIEDVAEAVSSV